MPGGVAKPGSQAFTAAIRNNCRGRSEDQQTSSAFPSSPPPSFFPHCARVVERDWGWTQKIWVQIPSHISFPV
jgi:hypothetical protein